MLHPAHYFDLEDEFIGEFFEGIERVWEAIPRISAHALRLTGSRQTILGQVSPGAYMSDRPIFIDESARIDPGAYILGPAYIGANAVVGHGAFVRDNVILMPGSVLGHASEAKNSLFLPGAHAPHFNYVGDSILGRSVNLGAGTKLGNLGIFSLKDKKTGKRPSIRLTIGDRHFDSGLAKLGAILADDVQTGCNAVLNPGCLVGPRTVIYANLSLPKGYYPPDRLIKLRQTVVQTVRRR